MQSRPEPRVHSGGPALAASRAVPSRADRLCRMTADGTIRLARLAVQPFAIDGARSRCASER